MTPASDEVYFALFATVGIRVDESRYAALAAPMERWLEALGRAGAADGSLRDLLERARAGLGEIRQREPGEREAALQELFCQDGDFERGSLGDELARALGSRFVRLGWPESSDLLDNRAAMMEGPTGLLGLLNINPPFPEGEDGERAVERAARDLERLARELGLSGWSTSRGAYTQPDGSAKENAEIDWELARGWEALREAEELGAVLAPISEEGEGSRGRSAL